jgi:hypothetical protein
MADKKKYIPNDDKLNFPSCRLILGVKPFNNQLNEPTNQNSIKVPIVVEPTNNKTFLENFGDYCNNQPNIKGCSFF